MQSPALFDFRCTETKDGFSAIVSRSDEPGPDSLPFDALVPMMPALSMLYHSPRDRGSLDFAIQCWEHAVSLVPNTHRQKYDWCRTLAFLYMCRYATNNSMADLDRMVSLFQTSVDTAPEFYADRADHLYHAGLAYLERRSAPSGVHTDADSAEMFIKQAIDAYLGSEAPDVWHHLSSALSFRYEYSGSLKDLDQSICAKRLAISKCTDTLQRRTFQAGLCHLLAVRFRHAGNQEDAAKLDTVAHEAAGGIKTDAINALAVAAALCERCRHSGRSAELDKAVMVLSKLLESMNEPFFRWIASASLSGALHERFLRFGDPKDQEYSLSVLQEVAKADFCHERPMIRPDILSNLGSGHYARFQLSKDPRDLDEAIAATRQAIDSTPEGHWSKHSRSGDLGWLLERRFTYFRRIDDLDEAQSCFKHALHRLPDDHRDKSRLLRYLGRSHIVRFRISHQFQDINKAVETLQAAVEFTPKDYPERVLRLLELGLSLKLRVTYAMSQDASDQDGVISAFREAALLDKGPFDCRMRAAWFWGNAASVRWFQEVSDRHLIDNDDSSAPILPVDLYEESYKGFSRMMDLIPLAVWLGDTIPVRHGALESIGTFIFCFAAENVCLQYSRPTLAVEWLEQGRSVIWRQQLNLRTRFDELQDVEPALAASMRTVSASLDSASTDHHVDLPRPGEPGFDTSGPPRRRLAEEWESLLVEARQVPGFERLLRPNQLSELRRGACIGPIVMLNMGRACHALAVLQDRADVLHVPLSVPIEHVEQLRADLCELLTTSNVRSRLYRKEEDSYRSGSREMQRILFSLWIEVVKPVLDALGFPALGKSGLHPRIVWCPTGSFAFLPIHAAGDYSSEEPGHRISDFVVSSYTSTISTLLDALNRHVPSELRCLTVSQSETPGLSSLPCTEMEVRKVKQHVGPAKVEELNGEAATVAAVHDAMERCSWLHLACHAIQDSVDPLKSAFCLADGNLQLQDIIRKSHPHADFAFLSACQTSTGDQKLADEAVHLAAGMQLAGYKSIIATMWSIGDEDGPVVADEVYAHMLHDGHPDSSRAAHALHHAVLKLQNVTKPEDRDDKWFLRWVPFIHIGA